MSPISIMFKLSLLLALLALLSSLSLFYDMNMHVLESCDDFIVYMSWVYVLAILAPPLGEMMWIVCGTLLFVVYGAYTLYWSTLLR